jgi:hypothetical protein
MLINFNYVFKEHENQLKVKIDDLEKNKPVLNELNVR